MNATFTSYANTCAPTEEQQLENNKYMVELLCKNGFNARLEHNQEAADMMCLDEDQKIEHVFVDINNKTMILAYDRWGYCIWDLDALFDNIEIDQASPQEVVAILRVATTPTKSRK